MATAILNKTSKKVAIVAHITQESHGRGFLSANLSLQRFPIVPFIVATDFRHKRRGGLLHDGTAIKQYSAVIFERDDAKTSLQAGQNGIQFLLSMGEPLNEQNVFDRPFVMTTADQLLETKRRFGRGEMGQLNPSVNF
jgi:hypothetical protein